MRAAKGSTMPAPVLTRDELERLLAAEFPQMFNDESGLALEQVSYGGCRVRQAFRPHFLRPGGTIPGPTMMALADFSMYVAVLSAIGWVPLAVTTNLTINFLRKPPPRDLTAEVKLLKLGRRLAYGAITICSDAEDGPVAHATSTYAIPS
jgi:acyl-coenzyme A thioesterase PaaI-like protein